MKTSSLIHTFLIQATSGSSTAPPEAAARVELQHRAESWFIWLLVLTGIVVVGVCFEAPEAFHNVKVWLRDPNPNKGRNPLWSAIGVALVVLGVAGEGVFEGLVGMADTSIRNFDGRRVAENEQETAGAKREAAAANERAALLEAENLKQREVIAALTVDTGTAKGDAARAIDRTTRVETQELATERAVLLRETRSTVIREAQPALVSALKPFGEQKVEVRFELNTGSPEWNVEVIDTAVALVDSFSSARWRLPISPLKSNSRGRGVLIVTGKDAPAKTIAVSRALATILSALPMYCVVIPNADLSRPEQGKIIAENVTLSPVTPDLIVVEVLQHP